MRAVLVFLICFLPSLASGQEYERFRLPEGQRCTVASVTYQCFDLGEYTELLHMDEDLRFLTEVHDADVLRIAALTQAVSELQSALTSAQSQIDTLETERERLTTMWQEENRLRHEAENRPDWNWIPWTLAAVFAVTSVVLAIVVGVQ